MSHQIYGIVNLSTAIDRLSEVFSRKDISTTLAKQFRKLLGSLAARTLYAEHPQEVSISLAISQRRGVTAIHERVIVNIHHIDTHKVTAIRLHGI